MSPSPIALKRVLGVGLGAEADGRAGAIAQFQMAGQEVGVQVGEEHVRDVQVLLARERQVLLDVALRVDDYRRL